MQLLNLTLSYLLQEIQPLINGSFVNKIQELSSDKFRFKLHTSEGTKNLFLFPNAIFLSDYKIEAKKQTSGFGAFLRKRLQGKKILSVKQQEKDRILLFEFHDYFLILELYASGNIILTEKNLEIISAMKKEESKNRKISKKEIYSFPESKKLSLEKTSFKEFSEKFSENLKEKNNLVLALISTLDIAPLFAEKIFYELKIKEKPSEKRLKKVFDAAKKIYSMKEKPFPVVIQKGKEKIILPFKLSSIKNFEKVSSLNSALDDFYSKQLFSEKAPEKKPKKLIALEHSFKAQLEHEKKIKKEIIENRKKAETIYENNLLIQEISDSVKKGFAKGLTEKEILKKINSFLNKSKKNAELVSLTRKKVLLNFKEN